MAYVGVIRHHPVPGGLLVARWRSAGRHRVQTPAGVVREWLCGTLTGAGVPDHPTWGGAGPPDNSGLWGGDARTSPTKMRPPRGTDPASIDTSLVECLVVVVPETTSLSSVAAAVAELVETAAIRILDLVVVTRRRSDHEVHVLESEAAESLPEMSVTRELGGLLSENDIALAASSLLPGAVGLVMLIEDRWASPLSSAAKHAGGLVLGGQRIPRARIEAALVDRPVEPGTSSTAPEDRDRPVAT
jgi:hypothetical protein